MSLLSGGECRNLRPKDVGRVFCFYVFFQYVYIITLLKSLFKGIAHYYFFFGGGCDFFFFILKPY